MLLSSRRFISTALVSLTAIILADSAAHGQRTNPSFRIWPTSLFPPIPPAPAIATSTPGTYGTPGTISASSPYAAPPTASNPYGSSYSPYGGSPSSYYAPSDLQGTADVINGKGLYQVRLQQARFTQAQADSAKLDLRRRILDEARYERTKMPNPEDVRIAEMVADLNHSRRDPPLAEITSGKALNDLYIYLANEQNKGIRGPNVPLDEDILKRINLTNGSGGSVGIIKDDGKLQWPLSLQGADFLEARKRMEATAGAIVRRLKDGNAPAITALQGMEADMNRLADTLAKNVVVLSPTQFIEAKRYLNHLEDAVKALQGPNVVDYFTQKWTAKGRTVDDLVKNMSEQGLRFAAATPGDEPAYRALHQALIAYDAGAALVTVGQR